MRGFLKYKYDVKVDLSALIDRIMDNLGDYITRCTVEIDEEKLILHCKDEAAYLKYPDHLDYEKVSRGDVYTAVLKAFQETKRVDVDLEMGEVEVEDDD